MNYYIVDSIGAFIKASECYQLSSHLRMEIILLAEFTKKWLEKPDVGYLQDNLTSILINLALKISNSQIESELINMYNDLVFDYLESVQKNGMTVSNDLSDIFKKMTI